MAPRSTRRAQQAAKDARQLQQAAATAIATPAIPPLVAPAPPTTSTRRSKRRAPSPPRKPARSTTPADRLSPLSSELLALILSHLSPPASPDLPSLFAFSLVSRSLLPHVRTHMYRELRIDTRVNAHALHRTLHGNEVARVVRGVEADVGRMSKTSSQWVGWFLFHSLHSLCGIIGSCRSLLTLTLYLPADASAWTQSLCGSLVDLKHLHTLTKDLEPSLASALSPGDSPSLTVLPANEGKGAGASEGMDVGWRAKGGHSGGGGGKGQAMWSVSQFIKPLATLRSLRTLRLCGISSDSSTSPPSQPHSCRLVEVVLVEVNITNSDLLHLLGNASQLKKLTLWRSSLLSKRGLTHLLKKCPNLVELRVGGSWFGAKEEDDTNFPLDHSLPSLPHLRLLHASGSLISPAILLQPSTNLTHLLVTNAPSFTPLALHSALCKMPCAEGGAPPVRRLTLPEMREGKTGSGGEKWSERWCFSVRQVCEAKGVVLEGAEGGENDGSESD